METRADGILNFVDKYQLWFFFITTIILAWIFNPLISLIYGIFLIFLLILITKGWDGIRVLLDSLLKWKVGLQWYVFAIFITIIVMILALILATGLTYLFNPLGLYPLLIIAFSNSPFNVFYRLLTTLGSVLEFGYVMPVLLKRHTPLVSGLIVGMASFLTSTYQYSIASLFITHLLVLITQIAIILIPFAVILVWIFDQTEGSLVIVFISMLLYTLFVHGQNNNMYPIGIIMGCIYIIAITVLITVYRNFFLKKPSNFNVKPTS